MIQECFSGCWNTVWWWWAGSTAANSHVPVLLAAGLMGVTLACSQHTASVGRKQTAYVLGVAG